MIREYIKPLPLEDVLEEHTEEAAFMYESRLRCHTDPELSWEDLREYEQRMFSHLDGLVLGGSASAKFLKPKLSLDEDEEPGEPFVASITCSMLDLIEPMQWLINALSQKPPHFRALVDGIKYSKGNDISGWLEHLLNSENTVLRTVGAEVAGYRRDNALKNKLVSFRNDPDPHVSMAAIYSLAEMGIMPDKDALAPFLNSTDPGHIVTAIELLLRTGAADAVNLCRDRCKSSGPEANKKLVLYLAISGTGEDIQVINKIMHEQPSIKGDCLLALGLYGHAASVDVLIDHLGSVDDLSIFTAAYQGLRLITGLDYLPLFDPDEAEPAEILEYQNMWKNWWHGNRANFTGIVRWRRGKMISPAVLYKDLTWPGNSCRRMTYLEMVIRYGCTVDFQYDQLYDVQVTQLQGIKGWANQQNNKFQQGIPYYQGRPLT